MMRKDGLDPDDLYRAQAYVCAVTLSSQLMADSIATREYSMAGTYRKIMHRPGDLTYKLMHYDDANQPLSQTDEELVTGRSIPPFLESGAHQALQISMTLGSSTYATMALREVLKQDTSAGLQKELTKGMEKRAADAAAEAEAAAAAPSSTSIAPEAAPDVEMDGNDG